MGVALPFAYVPKSVAGSELASGASVSDRAARSALEAAADGGRLEDGYLWARDAASLVVSAAYDAVTTRLFALPDDTVVYPGHDYRGKTRSTIGAEKRTNLRFAGKTRHEYIELMAQLGLPFPEQVQRALQVNQAGFEETEVCFPLMADMAALHALVASELVERLASATPPLVLDVREPEEFVGELGHIAGSLLVPMDALAQRLPKLIGYVERDVVVVCRAGARSANAGAMLRRAGFPHVFNLRGGMLAWATSGLPVMR